ncbi:hypothetical protein B0H14DRAFT_3511900 [Mycena olivaceomarginata]|nr:hypothetical protein B0H14DRAFT_3511900 [Mycena olivaceomarginata]
MSQRWFPRVDPTFVNIALFAESKLSGLVQHTLAKPSLALDTGDRIVVVTGESQGSVSTIERVRNIRIANEWVSMARVITPNSESIDVGLAQLKRHGLDLYYNFWIHDQVCVVSGELYVGATGRVKQMDGRFLTVTIPNNSEIIGATLPSTISNRAKIFIISIVHVTCQWAIRDSEPEPPSNPPLVTYRGPFCSDTEKGPAPLRSTTPTLANAAVWASQWQPPLEGEDTSSWLCLPELAFKRLDVQGRKGWVLPTSAIPRDTKKVNVCSIGKNGTMHPIDKTCVKPFCTDDEHPLGETVQHIVIIGPDTEGSSNCPGEYTQIVPLALHDYPSYVLYIWFIDGSTPTHDWIDDYKTKAASLSAEVFEAKAVAEGDPTNAAKVLKYHCLATSYAEQFGPLEPDAEVSSYIARRTRHEYQMDKPRHRAISDSCPFTNPRPLDTYYEAMAAFDCDFGHKYKATDEYKDRLSMKCKLRDIYKKILDLPENCRTRLVSQQAFSTSLQNLLLEHNLRRITFDNKLRDHVVFYTRSTADSFAPTLHCTTIHLVFRNPSYAEPLSIKCIRQYCKHTMWFEELEVMEAEAQHEAHRRVPPSPIPTHILYGAVDTALH